MADTRFLSIVDASIADLQQALSSGSTTSVELVARYLYRISTYDANGLKLSSIPILNPSAFEEAAASDARRAAKQPLRPLEGIPYLVKDSIKVKGQTVASGSPAFEKLVANEDAACVEVLRNAGAIVIGRTNMCPMAYGGMQRGLYGRAESPYNLAYLTAAYASGSSNGSGTAITASFGAFGLGSETVSSGRSPASNNALITYTPSKCLLALRGVWPLYPTCDVLAPHTRTMSDLFDLLNVLAVSDKTPTGDFWNTQPFVPLPKVDDLRPTSYNELKDSESLRGKRIGVPTMYIGGDSLLPIKTNTRPSVLRLWEKTRQDLEACGAIIVEVDFPLIQEYEKEYHTGKLVHVKNLPEGWPSVERGPLVAHAWDDFLVQNGQADIPSLSAIDPDLVFPLAPGTILGELETSNTLRWEEMVEYPKTTKSGSIFELSGIEQALKALEEARKETYEQWMDRHNLDAVAFPANGDVGPANADVDKAASSLAWRNGVKYSNGNRPIRHLGVPTISVPMGVLEDIQMPVNLTIATKAYDDNNLLRYGYAFETATKHRVVPPLTPQLASDLIPLVHVDNTAGKVPRLVIERRDKGVEGSTVHLHIEGHVDVEDSEIESLTVSINGVRHEVVIDGHKWQVTTEYPTSDRDKPWVKRTSPALAQTIVVIVARSKAGLAAGELLLL